MSFSFLDNLWDTDESNGTNQAFTAEQTNPNGRRYAGDGPGSGAGTVSEMAVPIMAAPRPQTQSYATPNAFSASRHSYLPDEQHGGQDVMQDPVGDDTTPRLTRHAQAQHHEARFPFGATGNSTSHQTASSAKKENQIQEKQTMVLLRALIGKLYELSSQQETLAYDLQQQQLQSMNMIQNLSYILYALLGLCVVIVLLIALVCYKLRGGGQGTTATITTEAAIPAPAIPAPAIPAPAIPAPAITTVLPSPPPVAPPVAPVGYSPNPPPQGMFFSPQNPSPIGHLGVAPLRIDF